MNNRSSDSSDDEIIILACAVRRRRRQRRNRLWQHPYWDNAEEHSPAIVSQQLLNHPVKFQTYYKMEISTFNKLLDLMEPSLSRRDTNYRLCVSVKERLLIFLRYLATGDTFTSLSLQFYRGISTISEIVADTAKKLWSVLQPMYMSTPDEQRWLEISKRFYEISNVPNCLGCIDGKHIRIKCPQKSGSTFYNYHDFFSVVLMACTDADGLFTWISVGEFGRNSDGRVIKESGFYDCIEENKLNIPDPQPLPNDLDGNACPFYFIGDQAFPLKIYLMRPYPRKTSNDAMKTFNYRISRARRSVECGFGMLVSKFRLFVTQIECEPTKVEHIVKASCILHNFIRTHDGFLSIPTYEQLTNSYQQLHPFRSLPPVGQHSTAKEYRDYLRDYFSKPENSLPWQNRT